MCPPSRRAHILVLVVKAVSLLANAADLRMLQSDLSDAHIGRRPLGYAGVAVFVLTARIPVWIKSSEHPCTVGCVCHAAHCAFGVATDCGGEGRVNVMNRDVDGVQAFPLEQMLCFLVIIEEILRVCDDQYCGRCCAYNADIAYLVVHLPTS